MGKKETYFDEAEDLYVVEGLSLEAIAARLGPEGPSVTTLSIWKQEGEWSGRRRELARSLRDIKKDSLLLRQKLLEKVLKSPTPQDIYAWARVEEILSRARPGGASPLPEPAGLPEIKTPAQAVALLEDAVQRKLWGMLSEPGQLTLAAIKDLKQVWVLIDSLKAQYRPAAGEAPAPGLSEEAAEEITRQILGIQ